MIIPVQVIRALEALAENGTACIDGSDRDLFRTVARSARYENQQAHAGVLPYAPPLTEIYDGIDAEREIAKILDRGQDAGETILRVEPYNGDREEGFRVVTDQQTITLAIDSFQDCCENWGYFISEDELGKFKGAKLLGVTITDENLQSHDFIPGYADSDNARDPVYLDEGSVMFVNVETDRGKLQFAAYNGHNGYYGHEARVESRQLTHSEYL